MREGTVVTIHLPNCPQAVMAIYAVAKLGGICNMVHALMPEAALRKNLTSVGSSFLITHLAINPVSSTIITDVSAYMDDSVKKQINSDKHFSFSVMSFEDMEKPCDFISNSPIQSHLADTCAFYLHSGGTTGMPKTIMLSHSAVNHCVDNTSDFFRNHDMSEQISLCVLPLFHGFGLVMDVHRNVSFKSTQVQMTRWDAGLAVRWIKQYRVTLIVGVPAMYYALLHEAEFSGDGIRQLSKCFVGGDTVPPELIRSFDERVGGKRCLFAGFGLTEATTTDCVNTYLHDKIGSCGYPVRDTHIAVMDADGRLHRCGIGEFVISSKTLMMGYLNDAEATRQTLFEADGRLWTRTGDEVEIDEDGFVFFKDRIKNIIIHNGYNIYPGGIEEIIRGVPGVIDACLIGVENPVTRSQDVLATILLDENQSQADCEKAIAKVCSEHFPRYAVPRYYRFFSQFPQTPLGKTDRKKLRALI